MVTVQQIYDAYPDREFLNFDPNEDTFDDIEDSGDTLFVFFCREFANPCDHLNDEDLNNRLIFAIRDILVVASQLTGKQPDQLIAEANFDT